MDDLEKKLLIGLIEPENSNAKKVQERFEAQRDWILGVQTVTNKKELLGMIKDNSVNTLVINIFNYGISEGIEIIKDIRRDEKTIPICILGKYEEFKNFDSIHNDLKNFKDFCKIAIDVSSKDLDESIKRMSKSLFYCRQEKVVKQKLNTIKSDSKITDKERIEKLEEITEQLLKLFSDQGKEANKDHLKSTVSSLSSKSLGKIIQKTLDKTSKSIELYKWINFTIIVVGLFLVLGSAIYTVVAKNPQIITIAFGGTGLLGIIASLITNPTSSISKTARQMIQIQIGYFGFLEQLELLDNQNKNVENDLEKSKQLNKVTYCLLKSLSECFDDSKEENGIYEEKK